MKELPRGSEGVGLQYNCFVRTFIFSNNKENKK